MDREFGFFFSQCGRLRGMNRDRERSKGVRFRGEELEPGRIQEVRRLIRHHREATQREIAKQVCLLWDWRQPNGELSLRSCRDLLHLLEERELIELPAARTRPGRRKTVTSAGSGEASGECAKSIGANEVDLRRVVVRPVRCGEIQRWRRLMAQFHYLGDGELVGESLRYVAESECGWLALLGWNAAAWKSRYREAYIGWDERTKQQRLRFVINNSRFLILPWVHVPHLASSVLGATLRRLSADWLDRYGHPIVLAETFVDLERFRGTCYRAANWTYLGLTRGMGREGDSLLAVALPRDSGDKRHGEAFGKSRRQPFTAVGQGWVGRSAQDANGPTQEKRYSTPV